MWHPDEQAVKEARARDMTDTRLCVYCKAADVLMDKQRESKADMRGRYVTFELPAETPAQEGEEAA